MQKKKCLVCNKEKELKQFAMNGKSPRCIECKNKSNSKRKPNDEHFGI